MSDPLPHIRIESDYPPPFERRWFGPRFWLVWPGVGLLWLISRLPSRVRHALARRIGDLAYARSPKRRAIVMTNLEWCFPELDEAGRATRARDYFRAMSQGLVDYGLLWWSDEGRLDRLLVLEGAEYLEQVRAANRPVILLTSHNVALDFGALALTRRFASVGLVKTARNPLMDWLMARGRTRFKGILFRREDGMRPVVRAIKAGYAFYYLPDEDLGPEHSVFVPFFGVPAATITALSRLARITKAAVLPYASYFRPADGRYVAQILPPLDGFPSDDETLDAGRMNAELERLIHLAPGQYMWSLRLFQTRPDGSPPPYAMKGRPGSGPRPRPPVE